MAGRNARQRVVLRATVVVDAVRFCARSPGLSTALADSSPAQSSGSAHRDGGTEIRTDESPALVGGKAVGPTTGAGDTTTGGAERRRAAGVVSSIGSAVGVGTAATGTSGVGTAAADGAAAAPPVSIPAASGVARPAADVRSVTDHHVVPMITVMATAPNTSHGSRKRRRLRAATRGTIKVRSGSVRSMLGSTVDHRAPRRPYYTGRRVDQLARFSGGGAFRSAAARAFTDAAYMST